MFMLIQDRNDGRFYAVGTNAASEEAARRQADTAAVTVVGFRDSYQTALQEAAQLNAANGIIEQGCSTCG